MATASTTEEESSVLQRFHEQQKNVARLSIPNEARLIVDLGRCQHIPYRDNCLCNLMMD